MSPDQGRRRKSGKGGSSGAPGRPSGPAAARRRGLILFGAVFLVIFVVVAIAEGVGDPSVPSGDVALVEGAPGDLGEITEADLNHTLELAAAQGGGETPKPGDPKYDAQKEEAMKTLLEGVWLQTLADERGIEVSDEEIAAELKKIKKESFKSEAEFEKFLKESHYTPADVDERVKLQILSKELQEQLKEEAPAPSKSEVEDYYEAAKGTQFTQKPSRDVRIIFNKDQKKVESLQEALTKDNSAKNWEKLAKKYSTDPNVEASGGLQKGIEEGTVEEPINAAIFSAPEGQVEGPIKSKFGYAVFQVESSTPESVQELKAVESQIQSTLAQRSEQEYFTGFVSTFNSEFVSRTFCAAGYAIKICSNFKADGHPSTAPPACYEADPKGGLPEACPAPVFQLVPALPGTVTPLEPQGKPLAQRPLPAAEADEGAAGAAGELPEGVTPPPAETPSE